MPTASAAALRATLEIQAVDGTLLVQRWIRELGPDALAMGSSALMVGAYYFNLRVRVRRNPATSIHVVNEKVRTLWVEHVMANPSKDVMAVQTLRNFVMVGILLVSTATLLIIGTLTLTGQADNMARSWHAINVLGPPSVELWIVKVICLLADFLVAFFSFVMSIRLVNHVVFMLNVPSEMRSTIDTLTPRSVARRLNRAGYMMAFGIRALFFSVPLVFWLFGPALLVIATIGVLVVLSRLDRNHIIV